ncbi:MAG TPA: helix-turn-helix domain-containing protein [Candidatus Dormibacteraeota bacterium]
MATRRNPLHEATLNGSWTLQRIGRELRLARITGGKTQRHIANKLGTSQSRVSIIERGRCSSATVLQLTRHAASVGLRLHIAAYPGGRRLLDGPQLALLNRFRARIAAIWRWEQEVPIPIEGDLRAADARLTAGGTALVIEAITRLADVQAQTRAAQLKRRDLGAQRLILLLASTATNRRAVREAGPALSDAFPIASRSALEALAAGRDPGGDALLFL